MSLFTKHITPPEMPDITKNEDNVINSTSDANSSSIPENNSGEPRPSFGPAREDEPLIMSYIWSDEFLSNVSWGEEFSEFGFSSTASSEDGLSWWLDYEDFMNEDFGLNCLNEVKMETLENDEKV